ncbi:a-macroglobulin complement component [Stylonychia lemnae]|uniref:A-macroglobulin complement component n=1 Tax=Stylonychia lemnae TaxID=5949 RepID=A0A078B465_STYLE|nr:a-macroglobulin complement component [Stylonychia lemnae]|eukprot:CDW88298.1 a-macroglobulin complement component [Stylonychia lemnae]
MPSWLFFIGIDQLPGRPQHSLTQKQGSDYALEPSNQVDIEQIKKSYNDTVEEIIPSSASRFLAHIQTDKVVYRPGDIMFVQAYLIDALNKTPAYISNFFQYASASYYDLRRFPIGYVEQSIYLSMTIIDPLGVAVYTTTAYSANSTVSFTYIIPENASGGEYQVRVSGGVVPESIRVVRIREYQRQQLNVQVQFDAQAYKPGDDVNGTIRIATQDGSTFPNGVTPSYTISVNFGNESQFTQANVLTDQNGLSNFYFSIPSNISLDFITVAVIVYYQATIEAYSFTLSIVQVDNLVVEFFPETFNYVYDTINKVYFQVYANSDKVDFVEIQQAQLLLLPNSSIDLSNAQAVQSNINTVNQGRGYFNFTPTQANDYYLRFEVNGIEVVRPLNVSQQPDIQNLEINFGIMSKVISNDEDLVVLLQTNSLVNPSDLYVVGVFNKEKILYLEEYQFTQLQTNEIIINASEFSLPNGGVLRVAVFKVINALIWYDRYDFNAKNISTRNMLPNPFYDIYFIPKGELLFFKNPSETLMVEITTSKQVYKPGEFVEFQVQVLDRDTRQPVYKRNSYERSFISVTVTDNSVFSQIQRRQQPPSLPTMVYLENEVNKTNNEFFNSDQYIDYMYIDNYSANETSIQDDLNQQQSNVNLDLLLGVQGWRYGYFYPQVLQEWPSLISTMSKEEARQIQDLLAYTFQGSIYYPTSVGTFANGALMAKQSSDVQELTSSSEPSGGQAGGQGEQQGQGQGQGSQSQVSSQAQLSRKELEFWNFLKKYAYCDFEQNTRLYRHAKKFQFFEDVSTRFDTTETVFYQAAVLTDNQGKYSGSFYISDLITQFRISANAFDTRGVFGYKYLVINSRSNFYIEFQLPSQMSVGDELIIPVTIYNYYNETLTVNLYASTDESESLGVVFLDNNNSEIRVNVTTVQNQAVFYIRVRAQNFSENTYVQIRAVSLDPLNLETISDSIFRETSVVSPGVQQTQSQGGLVGPNQPAEFEVILPESMVPGTQSFIGEVYPSSFVALVRGILRLIGLPGPCFECIYGPVYANILAYQAYLKNTDAADDISNVTNQLEIYHRDIKTYISSEGYVSQFKGGRGDVLLTAFALLELRDVNKIFGNENSSIQTLTTWLLDQRGFNGTYELIRPIYTVYPQYVVEAFIVYALTSVGITDIQAELLRLEVIAADQMNQIDADNFFIGLMAAIYQNLNRTQEAEKYADYLASQQNSDGSIRQIVIADNNQIPRYDQVFEATAVAVLVWEQNFDKYSDNIVRGIDYLLKNIRYRYFGANIGSILAIEALIGYISKVQDINGYGDFVLYVDNNEADRVPFDVDTIEPIIFNINSILYDNETFVQGNDIQFEILVANFVKTETRNLSEGIQEAVDGPRNIPTPDSNGQSSNQTQNQSGDFRVQYQMSVSYDDTNPTSRDIPFLTFNVTPLFELATLGQQQLQGQVFSYQIVIGNSHANDSIGLTIVDFRPASCLRVNFAQLEALKANNVISQYEVLNNNSEILLYFEGFQPQEIKQFQLDFLQVYSGYCQQRPINAYQFYSPEVNEWIII